MAKIGKLDQLVTFQEPVSVADGGGGSVVTFQDFATNPQSWASVFAVRGDEEKDEGRVNATGLYRFNVRYRGDVDERHIILWGGQRYNIRNVRRTGGRALYMTIEAERGV